MRDVAVALDGGWELAQVSAGACSDPAQLAAAELRWHVAEVPGTVASALDGRHPTTDLDSVDWWYRCRLDWPGPVEGENLLRMEGLATIATVWLNGARILEAANMFLEHEVPALLRPGPNELHMRFHALAPLLQTKRPRPRWRARLVDEQQLRGVRTTLIGHMPGWCPRIAPVGPWRPVTIARRGSCSVAALHARAELHGPGGELHVEAEIALDPDTSDVELHAVVDDQAVALAPVESGGGRLRVRGTIPLRAVQPWWPHSHGEPRLYELTIEDRGAAPRVLARRRIGFRTVELHADAERGFALSVNGERIFCRGVCWTPLSLTRLHGRRADYVEALTALRDAGANMIRVSGTMVYEADAFHDLCDELGILVWQDFMFANMDYPVDDGFLAGAAREARQVAGRLVRHPSLALLCGNSEVHQQVGMLGLSPELWQSRLFDEVLPAVCAEVCPDVPYRPSSPSGGALAFHVDAGDSHYFGVGAWLRPTSDGRHSGVRFASECLGFANVPGDDTIDLVAGPGELAVHHPRWKAGTPRDPGAGWDFEDVRDHYLQALFGVDPLALRRSDMPRYLALSRVASGEVMAEVFAGWRAAGSRCNGGLVWLFQDLVPGAGWGIRDSCGRPKAAYYHLKRAWASRTAFLLDDGLNGARLHVLNDGPAPCEVSVNVAAWRYGGSLVREASTALSLAPRDARELSVDAMLGGFLDTTYAYRFGPPAHDVLHAVLTADDHDGPLAEAFLFAHGRPTAVEHDIGLGAELERGAGEDAILRLETRHFAQSVEIRSPGYAPADNYFHLAPGSRRAIALQRTAAVASPSVTVQALNAAMPVRLQAREPVGA